MSKKRGGKSKIFHEGYGEVSDRLSKRNKYLMSCKSCVHFFQTHDDEYELCQNENVTEFDMVNTESSVYCSYWQPVGGVSEREKRMSMEDYIESKFRKSMSREARELRRDINGF